MQNNVFFLDKDKAVEFQNRCVVAIFFDIHKNIEFISYVGTNSIIGKIDGKESYIYLFDTPQKKAESGVVFRSRNRKIEKQRHQYYLFEKEFLEEYIEYRNNVYDYILNHLFTEWYKYFGNLFISEQPFDAEDFKYKKCSESIEKKEGTEIITLQKYFSKFLDGEVVFANPKFFNDPFDCDCELPDLESRISMLWNAFNSIKYSGKGSTAIKREDIERILKENELNKKNTKDIITRIIKESKEQRRSENDKETSKEAMEAIVDSYNRMINQVVSLKEKFRVFCATNRADDILMWGYYCDGGKGVSCKYKRSNIISSIVEDRNNCICIYGNVEYKIDKPQYTYTTNDLADNVFEYVIRCVFTKYLGWQHEKEFRYILMQKEFENNFIPIKTKIQEYFMGCTLESLETERYLSTKKPPIKRLEKAKDIYKLLSK